MMTLEEEFQKPVRDRLAEIVIPGPLPAWDVYPPETDYDKWLKQHQYEADQIVLAARACFDDIANGHGTIAGTFPSPVKRKRKRTRK